MTILPPLTFCLYFLYNPRFLSMQVSHGSSMQVLEFDQASLFPHCTLPTQPCHFAPFPQQRFPEPIPSTGQALLSNHHSPSESLPHIDCSLWAVNTEVMALSVIHQGSLDGVLNQGDDVDEVRMNELWVPVPHRCFRDGPLVYISTIQI